MFVHAINEESAVFLGIFTGTKNPGDIDAYVEAARRFDAWAAKQERRVLFVIVPDASYPSPNSLDRKRFADLKESCRARPCLFILVTPSALLRGVMEAVTWMSPQEEGWRMMACASFSEALPNAARFTPGAEGTLVRMERELRGRLSLRKAG